MNNRIEFDFDNVPFYKEPECPYIEMSDIIKFIPECDKKWLKFITKNQIWESVYDQMSILVELMMTDTILVSSKGYTTKKVIDLDKLFWILAENSYIGDVIDSIKDKAILNIVKSIKVSPDFLIEDKEIQSEVLDFLYKNDYKVKSINNKITII